MIWLLRLSNSSTDEDRSSADGLLQRESHLVVENARFPHDPRNGVSLPHSFEQLGYLMSKPSAKNARKKSNSHPSIDPTIVWGVRGAVGMLAIIMLILAWQEYQVKLAFSSTNEAWQSALRAKGDTADLKKSEFSQIPVKGSPSVASEKAGTNTLSAVSVDTYTWTGKLRSYAVKVYFGLGNDPPVEQVEVVGN